MAKEKEVVAPSKFKVKLKVHSQTSSTIIRPDLPMITDKTVDAVKWLADKGYKEEEIEIAGEKPSNWDVVFKPEEPTPVEVIGAAISA